jgi:hypothetical protein
MFKQFYFLHLDKVTAKTAGIRLFDPMYKIMELHGVSAVELNKDHKSHNHWRDFGDDTFIFCVVRNPVLRTMSEFSWWANYGDNGIRTHNEWRDSYCPFYTEENFVQWLKTKHVKNYQSGVIGDRVGRINLLVRNEGIRYNENRLRETILGALGIDHRFDHYPPDFEDGFMPADKKLLDVVNNSASILKLIEEYNQEDINIYRQASEI